MVDDLIATLPPFVQGLLVKAETATKVQKNKLVAGTCKKFDCYFRRCFFNVDFLVFIYPEYYLLRSVGWLDFCFVV